MICQACKEPKRSLKAQRSELLSSFIVSRCQSCINADRQPRWLIIMAAKSHGPEHVAKYVEERLYKGEDITLREIA